MNGPGKPEKPPEERARLDAVGVFSIAFWHEHHTLGDSLVKGVRKYNAVFITPALEALVEALERPVRGYGLETHFAEAHGLDDEYAAAVEALRLARGEG